MHIDNLKNREINNQQSFNIYNENGEMIEKLNLKEKIDNFWEPIYKQHENEILTRWDEGAMNEYRNLFSNNNNATVNILSGISIDNGIFEYDYTPMQIPIGISEHYECAMPVNRNPNSMKNPIINKKDVICQLKKLKVGKSPGPDGIKPEIYKHLINN